MTSDFKRFKQNIKSKKGIWSGEDVYFSQMRDFYTAAYLPKYPQKSPDDRVITWYIFSKEQCYEVSNPN